METECFDCYYCGQCDCHGPCEYCDNYMTLCAEDEAWAAMEAAREEYRMAFYTYIRAFEE